MLGRIVSAAGIVFVFFMAAATADIAEGKDFTHGTVVVAMGGGSIEDVAFQTGQSGDATFSFFVGYDKMGNLKGSFFVKRVFLASGARAAISTEITDLAVQQGDCTWVTMSGVARFKATWVPKPVPDHTFTLEAWNCDSLDDGVDMIWFEVRRPNGSSRPALSLEAPTALNGGNVMIPYPYDLP
ncbi:MAG: hypothetical protein P8013_04975 [Candidatus Sulfobium sp.]|jgi:hypothetical protein